MEQTNNKIIRIKNDKHFQELINLVRLTGKPQKIDSSHLTKPAKVDMDGVDVIFYRLEEYEEIVPVED